MAEKGGRRSGRATTLSADIAANMSFFYNKLDCNDFVLREFEHKDARGARIQYGSLRKKVYNFLFYQVITATTG
jgi:hypothetical protein